MGKHSLVWMGSARLHLHSPVKRDAWISKVEPRRKRGIHLASGFPKVGIDERAAWTTESLYR